MSHSQWFERRRQKFSLKNIILLLKRCQMESAPGQSSALDAVFNSISLRSLYVNQGLKKTTQVFSIRTTVEKIKINYISAGLTPERASLFSIVCVR